MALIYIFAKEEKKKEYGRRDRWSENVPSVGFSVAGLDRAKLGVYQFQSFLFIVVIVISILLKPTF